MGITVAVTGPTGEIGRAAVTALEREPGVDRIVGMARRPFDPAEHGWSRTEYRRGDILDPSAVASLVDGADVVVHLAFLIVGNRTEARRINVDGARSVFSAAAAAGRPQRLVYTSSVAAYGFHRGHPDPLTEDVAPRGSDQHYYSRQKAEVEQVLRQVTAGSGLDVYILRPCVVAGPQATALADFMPWNRVGAAASGLWRRAAARVSALRPPFPDPGFRLQLVHHDDVAAAIVAAALGRGPAGAYNIAGDGDIAFAEAIWAVGGRPVPVPGVLASATAEAVAVVPGTPSVLDWIQVSRASVLMDTTKAKRELGWEPRFTTQETLAQLAAAVRNRDEGSR